MADGPEVEAQAFHRSAPPLCSRRRGVRRRPVLLPHVRPGFAGLCYQKQEASVPPSAATTLTPELQRFLLWVRHFTWSLSKFFLIVKKSKQRRCYSHLTMASYETIHPLSITISHLLIAPPKFIAPQLNLDNELRKRGLLPHHRE